MKIILIFFIFLFFSSSTFSTNIRVINLEYLIDNNNEFKILISKIEQDQQSHKKEFKETENQLLLQLEKIEELKYIFNETELDKEKDNYNMNLQNFELKIKNFNDHYENQINIARNNILIEIINLLKKFSQDNEIDLILDSNNYILSSNSIDITNLISEQLNNINFDISFDNYK